MNGKTIAIRAAVNELIDAYDVMTVRQVFYQLASVRGVVPKTESGYRSVQRQVLQMRREGLLPWSFISDATRWMRKPTSYDSPRDAIRAMHRNYRKNLWASQGIRIEIWLEKDALAGVVSEVTDQWDVPLMISRGQSSDTFCMSAAESAAEATGETFVYALYDSDSYGRIAAEQIRDKLLRYSGFAPITFELLAVTDEQILDWELPNRPGKGLDGGRPVVELDAIPPDKLTKLVDDAIGSHVDEDALQKERLAEQGGRDFLDAIASDDGLAIFKSIQRSRRSAA